MGKEFYNSTETNYGDQIRVAMNRGDDKIGTNPNSKGDGIYILIQSRLDKIEYTDAILSPYEARKLATALTVAADYHEAKAAENTRPKNFNEKTEHLGVGSLLAYGGSSSDTWIKTDQGWRGGAAHGNLWEPYGIDGYTWDLSEFTVLYAAPKEG